MSEIKEGFPPIVFGLTHLESDMTETGIEVWQCEHDYIVHWVSEGTKSENWADLHRDIYGVDDPCEPEKYRIGFDEFVDLLGEEHRVEE